MTAPQEYRYIIDAFTPDTLPMARLAEYMRELAVLLGEPERVHFDRLVRGSAVLISKIDQPAVTRVSQRLHGLRDGSAPEDVRKAFRQLDTMLAADNAVGRLEGQDGADIIEFPGRTRPKPQIFGPFNQEGTLADHRLAKPVQATSQRLGVLKPQRRGVPALGFHPPHAPKALQENKMIPDRLLKT